MSLILPQKGRSSSRIITSISESDILGWWDFDEGTGSTITDKTGGTNGSATNTSWITGGPNNLPSGLDFDPASNSRVQVANSYEPDSGTICVWASVDDFDPGEGFSIVVGADSNRGFHIRVNETGVFSGTKRFDSGESVSQSGYSTGTLYFVAFGWNSAATDEVELWVNGSSAASNSGAFGTPDYFTEDLWFGRRDDGARDFEGQIFQGLLFNRKLTTTEIGHLYNSGNGGTYEQFDFAV